MELPKNSKYREMYHNEKLIEDIFHQFFEDTKLHPNQIEPIFEKSFNLTAETLERASKVTFHRLDEKYRKLQRDKNLSEEEIFKIAYLDLGRNRPWAIRILMKVFDLNISDATNIAWSTLSE